MVGREDGDRGSSDGTLPIKRVPHRDIGLTQLGLGTAQLGNLYRETTEEEAAGALDAAWDAGIRYFDTAPHYGLGLSERRLGRLLRTRRTTPKLILTLNCGIPSCPQKQVIGLSGIVHLFSQL